MKLEYKKILELKLFFIALTFKLYGLKIQRVKRTGSMQLWGIEAKYTNKMINLRCASIAMMNEIGR